MVKVQNYFDMSYNLNSAFEHELPNIAIFELKRARNLHRGTQQAVRDYSIFKLSINSKTPGLILIGLM